MTLYLIGLGLSTAKDITVQGLEIVKRCDKIYLENYTSLLQCTLADLEKLYGKKIIPAAREFTEQQSEKIIQEAKTKKIAFLVVGDPFSATTHIELFRLAKEKNVPVDVIHNASILTAIGITGLQLYKFGRTTSIPFPEDVPKLEAPYTILQENRLLNMHTLFLLDLNPERKKFMAIPQALEILESIERRKKEKVIRDDLVTVGCARLGSRDQIIKAGTWREIKQQDFGKPPYCLIIPAKKLHFMEEEMLKLYR